MVAAAGGGSGGGGGGNKMVHPMPCHWNGPINIMVAVVAVVVPNT